ncbi:MAG TPA: HD domain-containing phosphohydrolase [Nitrospirota bacterium]|nr:HD domain-containing phosphohydrolase [Nitrospirota bacterium]
MTAPKHRILILDGDETNRRLLTSFLQDLPCMFEFVGDGRAAVLKAAEFSPDLIFLDVRLPHLDGVAVCRQLKSNPETRTIPVVMLTMADDWKLKRLSHEAGADDFLAKPLEANETLSRTKNQLRLRDMDLVCRNAAASSRSGTTRAAELSAALQDIVRAQKNLKASYLDTIYRLTIIAEFKDEATVQHVKRVGLCCAHIARQLGWSDEQIEIIKYASPMHDIGKIGIPSGILLKPAALTPEELALVKTHTVLGGKILHGSHSAYLQMAERIALAHHERWDGTGYPAGLAREDIPLEGRVVAFADQYDSLRSLRPYKPPFDYIKAYRIVVEGNERIGPHHFDPKILEVFKDTHKTFEQIYEHHKDTPPVMI